MGTTDTGPRRLRPYFSHIKRSIKWAIMKTSKNKAVAPAFKPQTSSLLTIPLELRLEIYYYAVLEDEEISIYTFRLPLFLRACRQLYNEVLPIVWAANKFKVSIRMKHSYKDALLPAQCPKKNFAPARLRLPTSKESWALIGGMTASTSIRFDVEDIDEIEFAAINIVIDKKTGVHITSSKLALVAPLERQMIDEAPQQLRAVLLDACARGNSSGLTLLDLQEMIRLVRLRHKGKSCA